MSNETDLSLANRVIAGACYEHETATVLMLELAKRLLSRVKAEEELKKYTKVIYCNCGEEIIVPPGIEVI